jgi:hypothetical protein
MLGRLFSWHETNISIKSGALPCVAVAMDEVEKSGI